MTNKRPRLALSNPANSSTPTSCVSLTSLPIEILAEVLLYTCSPPTVLAVSRTCSFLYRSLSRNPDAAFIWRGVRRAFLIPLPDPPNGLKKSEADYAAFVFGGGVCEVCGEATREMYASFAAKIRLCGSWHCRRKFLDEILVNVTSEFLGKDPRSLWVAPVESTRCFYPSRFHARIWPFGDILFRKSDWEAFQRQLQAYKHAEQADAEGKGDEQTKRVLERCRAAKQRLSQIMGISITLVSWKWEYDQVLKFIKRANERWTKNLANNEGWDLSDLVVSQTYASLQRRKNLLLETIDMKDVSPIRSTIESELLTLKARHQRQKAEANYGEKLTELKKVYERMRCGTLESDASDPFTVPPLSVFFTLPSVRVLKGSPDPSALPPGGTSVPSDINSQLATSLIKQDVHAWLIPVQKRLMTLLGYPSGWQSASSLTVHPLKRVTARFFCRRCGEGTVGRGYQRERCLDLKGVCSHVCVAGSGKNIEEAPKESEIEAIPSDRNRQEKATSGGKKKTAGWTVDMFEKDAKAISVIRTILSLAGLSEESSEIPTAMKKLGGIIRCMTCKGWVVMDFETAIGHAHRHKSMEIKLLSTSAPGDVGFVKKDENKPTGTENVHMHRPVPNTRLAFERGTCDLLLGLSYRARRLCKKVNYGCKHCFGVIEQMDAVIGFEKPGNKGARAMSFNGLRSHVKEKHGIQQIGDEDIFCYTSIQESE